MKILIADDEKLVRFSVRSILEELKAGGHLEGYELQIDEAASGTALLEKIYHFDPRIVLVDIRMPGMSGLEVIEKTSGLYPNIKWIILSGYTEFAYARKALSLKVQDYLLKPVSPEELLSALKKCIEELKSDRSIRNSIFEKKLFYVINNLSAPEFDPYFSGGITFSGFLLRFNSPEEVERDTRRRVAAALAERWTTDFQDCASAFISLEEGGAAVILRERAGGESLEKERSFIMSGFPQVDCRLCRSTPDVESLLSELNNLAGAASPEAAASGSGDQSFIVRSAAEYAAAHFSEAIGVAQAADYLMVTPNYLSTVFKKERGISFTAFITSLRMEKAPEMLKTPGATVRTTAASLGYQSSRHFARIFRDHYGKSPSEYLNSK